MKEMVGTRVKRDINYRLYMPTICYSKGSVMGGFTNVHVLVFAIVGVAVFKLIQNLMFELFQTFHLCLERAL